MKNKKHKLLKFGSIGLLASIFGLAVVGYASKDNYYQPVKAEGTELKYVDNYANLFENVKNYIVENGTDETSPTRKQLEVNINAKYIDNIDYQSNQLWYTGDAEYTEIQFRNTNNNTPVSYSLVKMNNEETNYQTVYAFLDNDLHETGTYVINTQNTNISFYNYMYQQYLEENNPSSTNVGTGIINAIKSGLGLIGDLASQFLLGFSTLFWNTTANTLTTFGMFSLVMLGIGITFAVIKLVLNILRSNTGA